MSNLNTNDIAILTALRTEPSSIGELATKLGRGAGAMNRSVRGLEADGLVRKALDQGNARATLFEVTETVPEDLNTLAKQPKLKTLAEHGANADRATRRIKAQQQPVGEVFCKQGGYRVILTMEPRWVLRNMDGVVQGVSTERNDLVSNDAVDWAATMALRVAAATVLEPPPSTDLGRFEPAGIATTVATTLENAGREEDEAHAATEDERMAEASALLAADAKEEPSTVDPFETSPRASPTRWAESTEPEMQSVADTLAAAEAKEKDRDAEVRALVLESMAAAIKALDAKKEAKPLTAAMSADPIADLIEVDYRGNKLVIGLDAARISTDARIKDAVAHEVARYVWRRRNPKSKFQGTKFDALTQAAASAVA